MTWFLFLQLMSHKIGMGNSSACDEDLVRLEWWICMVAQWYA